MKAVIAVIRPILVQTMNSCAVKRLVVDLIEKYVKTTDNDIDNVIAATVKEALLKNC